MKVLVLGGGIVGVTTAYFLGLDGHEVTLVEAKDQLGLEATSGNAGIIAPGHSFAWASPSAPAQLVRSLLGKETAIRVKLAPDLRLYTWGWRFLRECTAERARHNTLIKLRLCQYSQAVMTDLVRREGIEYHAITRGALYLYRDPVELEAGVRKMALLAEHGQKQETLDAAAVARLDPVFEPVQDRIAGAIRDLGDTSGDSRVFSENLARVCREKFGATFRLGTPVTGLRAEGDRVVGAMTAGGLLTADAYVLALGVNGPLIARTVGVRLAVYPAKGYSFDVPAQGGRPGADPAGRRRAVARRLVPAGRSAAAHLDRRVRRLRLELDAAGFQQHPEVRARRLPGGRRLRPGRVPGVPPADDPGRSPHRRDRPAPEPLPQRRPRPHGLDDGVRHRADRRRPDGGPEARARPGRPRPPPRRRRLLGRQSIREAAWAPF